MKQIQNAKLKITATMAVTTARLKSEISRALAEMNDQVAEYAAFPIDECDTHHEAAMLADLYLRSDNAITAAAEKLGQLSAQLAAIKAAHQELTTVFADTYRKNVEDSAARARALITEGRKATTAALQF